MRKIIEIKECMKTFEGDGIPVTRAFPVPGMRENDPFLLFDHFGPINYEPGGASGVPAHPHCGFEAIDVHMTDLIDKRDDLSSYRVLAVCGGFSFGDVLGAGVGWANSILFNERLRAMFKTFLNRVDTITLGICNGCQMISHISSLVPGGGNFLALKENKSRQFESRLVSVEVKPSKSVFFEC